MTGNTIRVSVRQQQVLWTIAAHRAVHCDGPTLAEVAEALGIGISAVRQHVEVLIGRGLLTRRAGEPRTLAPTLASGAVRRWAVEIGEGRYEVDGVGPLEAVRGALDLWRLAGCPDAVRALTVRRIDE